MKYIYIIVISLVLSNSSYGQCELVYTNTNSTAWQSKLSSANKTVVLGCGTWNVNSTVKIGQGSTLKLKNGAVINWTGCNTNNPVFHLYGPKAAIIGENHNVITTDGCGSNGNSGGIIRIGHYGNISSGNINFNQVSNLELRGYDGASNYSTTTNVGIYITSNQASGSGSNTVYLNNIINVYFSFLDVGIKLQGYANGNNFSNLIFNRVGMNGTGSCVEFSNGAGQNNFLNLYHHFAANSTGFVFKNTSNRVMRTNFINNYQGEGGGLTGVVMHNPSIVTNSYFMMHVDGAGSKLAPSNSNLNTYFGSNNNILLNTTHNNP